MAVWDIWNQITHKILKILFKLSQVLTFLLFVDDLLLYPVYNHVFLNFFRVDGYAIWPGYVLWV